MTLYLVHSKLGQLCDHTLFSAFHEVTLKTYFDWLLCWCQHPKVMATQWNIRCIFL